MKLNSLHLRLTAMLMTLICTLNITAWAAEGYAVYTPDNTTLTFYYGDKPANAFSLNTGNENPEWYDYGTFSVVTRVVFDPSFAYARPTSTANWFFSMENLTSITGLNYLNTNEVTTMDGMFSQCSNLSTLNLSNFNTSNVTKMDYMFIGCSKLTTLNLSNFNTLNVTNMSYMFKDCTNLTSLDLSNFKTTKVKLMTGMFVGCSSLTSLDLSSFNTSIVYHMSYMFSGCSKLKTVFVGNNWTTSAVTVSDQMFINCKSIVGGAGTTYDASHVDATYARIDEGASKPGYFTAKQITTFDLWINGEQVTSENYSNITGTGISGKVYYNYWQKRLMLEDATIINATSDEACIKSEIDGLIINLIGTNGLVSLQTGVKACAMELANATIRGTGTLVATGRRAGILIEGGKTLTITNVSKLSATGNNYGIYASSPTNSSLIIKGSKTTVHTVGSAGAIRNMNSLVLEDGLEITQPVGGYFNGTILYDANGNIATQATISKPGGILGDLDGSGIVDVEDVNAAINIILKLKTINDYPGNGDMDGSGYIDVEDVNAMINIILKL
ncbi:MAG: BspA family leucine-rich repeat surface protein [Muribaculaceae bacterium]|nr:BspA family leucine-rich repeat surface protein [Muribaculaceae bacterium]